MLFIVASCNDHNTVAEKEYTGSTYQSCMLSQLINIVK